MSRHTLLLVPLFALVAPLPAQAAESGQIRGRVVTPAGTPAVGVEVTLSGPGIAGELATTTDESGQFRFIGVPVGTHELLFISEGHAPVRAQVDIGVGAANFVPITLQAATAGEEIIVEEELPVIDATSAAFSNSLSEEMLQNLPVGRSYQDAVNMLPGVYGRVDTSQGGPGDGNPSVRGEGQYGNNFLVDGISTRDPATKTFGTNVNFDAIEDIAVYTDGAPAEFGQFAGMLVNVVVKDGGDEHHGSIGYWLNTDASGGDYLIADLNEHVEVPTAKRDFMNHELTGTAGGPLIKEKLWYFTAMGLGSSSSVFEGMDPNAPFGARDANGLFKISWFATPDVTVRYMFNGEWANFRNYETSSQFLPESQSQRLQTSMSHLFTTNWQPDALTDLEIKAGFGNSRLDHIPMNGWDSVDVPTIVDLDTGLYTQNFTDFDLNRRGRLGGGINITRVLEGVAGDHEFKAGTEYWILEDERELIFTGLDGEGGAKYYAGTDANNVRWDCAQPDYSDCFAYYEYDEVGPLGHRGNLFTLYIQDDYQPVQNLTLNIGLRYDREALFQNEGRAVWMDDLTTPEEDQIPFRMNMPAPRLGLAWDVTGDSKTLVSAFAGRYYDIAGNSFADWGDTKSAYGFRYYERDPDTGELPPADQPTWEQDPSGHPLIYDSTLQPARLDKITVQFKREVIPLLALGVRGILSSTQGIPEDIDTDLDLWYITNPGDDKRRDYRALEFVAEKKFDKVWQLNASYTLSEAKGHTPGQFETASGGSWGSDGNNVGVYLDDVAWYDDEDVPEWAIESGLHTGLTRQQWFDAGYGWLMDGLAGLGTPEDNAGWYGYLPYHSFHLLKINGSYTLPFGTTLGLVYEFDSGHAWQKRTFVDLYGDYMGFAEGRGTRFMPAVHYIDARVAHQFDLQNSRSVELSLDLFNLPDLAQAITYYENDDENFGLTLYRQAPRAVRAGVKVRY